LVPDRAFVRAQPSLKKARLQSRALEVRAAKITNGGANDDDGANDSSGAGGASDDGDANALSRFPVPSRLCRQWLGPRRA